MRFYRTALQLAASEARQGHGKLAQELRDTVDAVRSRRGSVAGARPIPLAQPRGDLGELVTASYPDLKLTDLVLSSAVAEPLKRVLRENRGQTKLREHGLHARRKLLLVGPPGTGKTMSARALAGELHLPLYLVRFDSLLTKFLGETAAKLRLVFDAMHPSRGVYLFDEFDAIGAQRALPNAGEIRRILNSFLQFIELDESDSIIVAATNHAEILDHALVRRFDDVVTYQLPEAAEVEAILKRTLEPFRVDGADWVELARQGAGLSCAELVRACRDAAKDAVLEDRRPTPRRSSADPEETRLFPRHRSKLRLALVRRLPIRRLTASPHWVHRRDRCPPRHPLGCRQDSPIRRPTTSPYRVHRRDRCRHHAR